MFAIKCAQAAVIIGPFKHAEVLARATELGEMSLAQMAMAKEFMEAKLGMSKAEVAAAGVVQVCWT